MPLVFGAIAPHGGDILVELADDPAVMAMTRAAMEEMGRRCRATAPETIVVITPHGMVMQGVISIGAASSAHGWLTGGDPSRCIAGAFVSDLPLAQAIADEAVAAGVPMAAASRALDADDPTTAMVWLDWGALIPLWYTGERQTPRPRVVILAPDRRLPRETLVACGTAIARAADASGKRVALIASCDQGHAHDANGPYGYDPASAIHDKAMCEVIAANDLESLLDWPQEFMETAKVDAYWQTIMLLGALRHTPMTGELLSYEAPTYFGMAVAAYQPT